MLRCRHPLHHKRESYHRFLIVGLKPIPVSNLNDQDQWIKQSANGKIPFLSVILREEAMSGERRCDWLRNYGANFKFL